MTEAEQQVKLTLNADDYAAANRLHSLRYSMRAAPLAFWFGVLAIFVFFLVRPDLLPFREIMYGLAVVLAMPFVTYFWIAPFTARRTYRKQKALQAPLDVSWSDTGLRTVAANGDWTHRWSDYLRWDENDQVFLFYQAPRLFNILPKRVLSPSQIDNLRDIAKSRIRDT